MLVLGNAPVTPPRKGPRGGITRRMRQRMGGAYLLLLSGLTTPVIGITASGSVGSAAVVLPGFAPVALAGRRIDLGAERSYEWQRGHLPASIRSLGTEIAGPFSIVVQVNGTAAVVQAATFSATGATGHGVELVTEGRVHESLDVTTRTNVEYDGLATVTLTLSPRSPVPIDRVTVVGSLTRNRDLRLLAYEPKTIYNYNKQELFPLCGDLPYKSALGFVDTRRSFWLLTDQPAFPGPADTRPPTSMFCTDTEVRLVQPLLGSQMLTEAIEIQFAFLATPVRDMPPSVRSDRIVPRATMDEVGLGTRHLWWVEAVPHYALPYVDYPAGAAARLTANDRSAYPGIAKNRSEVLAWRSVGIERIPYMSLRAPSVLDPLIAANEDAWGIEPARRTPAAGDGAYKQGFERPYFSHRATGFSEYLVERLDQVAARLPVRGFYFDQAEPIGSANPGHLSPDKRIRPTEASDILAMRQFFKRLATALHLRGRDPLIYVHNSMATVAPAYTFVAGMVQGEEFNHRLTDLNYLSSTDFDTVQATFVARQYGIPIIWLEEVWSDYLANQRPPAYRKDSAAWLRSAEYEALWRNFMAVALLHDVQVWTLAPPELRRPLYRQLDDFGLQQAEFTGYWELDGEWREREVLISMYNSARGKQLAVVVNRTNAGRNVTEADLKPYLATGPAGLRRALGVRIPAQGFTLVSL